MSINQLFVGVIVLVGAFALGVAVKAVKNTLNKLGENANMSTIIDTIEMVKSTVDDVVVYLNGTVVKEIKAKSEDGKLTSEEAQEIFDQAKKDIVAMVKEDSLLMIANIVGDIDKWLGVQIEKSVEQNKPRLQ